MTTFVCFIVATIFALMPLGSTAQVIRLRRNNPIIDLGLGAVRQIVGPFGTFIISRKKPDGGIEEDVFEEDEVSSEFMSAFQF